MNGLENLFDRLHALSPKECRGVVTACTAYAMQEAEANTANRLACQVLEEHKALSAELAIRRMNNTGSFRNQKYTGSLLTDNQKSLAALTHCTASFPPFGYTH